MRGILHVYLAKSVPNWFAGLSRRISGNAVGALEKDLFRGRPTEWREAEVNTYTRVHRGKRTFCVRALCDKVECRGLAFAIGL